ncbi:PleD family two-component system response regulator [Pelotomaculum sp. PtaB.Bin117]|uniref:PleD family two-component system response regulator n=1 Tax=Pelotomaculum sp. PtaB.Bin117 TaxID=1811694 RepID=UPI0009C8B0CA|nr:PleD family two-component system response regulator [Pelotomaculum sp. PtaB.Bin117]OPX88728.1 MAG: Response regulator PleD [Pelotomaculum sp. PtaB.Bin117]
MVVDNARQKILIVDDMPANIIILHEILQDEYEIFFATSGADALAIVQAEKPDLVLLDIIMPGMDGYEVCEKLKADFETKNIPVIFVTAMGEVEDETKGLEIGAIDYLVKPVSPPIVKARVRNHLKLKRYQDILANLSLIDGLTGIANRRHFDEVFDNEWRRALRASQPLSVIMLDIDFFKKYNDFYGHLAGDDSLRQVADVLKRTACRAGDLAARYGGEEFSVVLPLTDVDEAFNIALKMHNNVRLLGIPHQQSEVSDILTVSAGVASMIPQQKVSPDILIKEADKALYKAKYQGRNRVIKAL